MTLTAPPLQEQAPARADRTALTWPLKFICFHQFRWRRASSFEPTPFEARGPCSMPTSRPSAGKTVAWPGSPTCYSRASKPARRPTGNTFERALAWLEH